MTATRRLKAATIVALAGVWAVASWVLWRTSKVPGDLHLSGLDPHDYFSAAQLHRTAHYEWFTRLDWAVGTAVQLLVLVALALLGRRIAGGFDLGRVGTGVMVGTFATLCLWIAGLPFGFLGLWWERRYHLSKQSYLEWTFEQWPSLLGMVVGLTILLTVLMLLAGWLRRTWWLAAGALLVAFSAGLVFVLGYVSVVGTHPIRDRRVASDVRRFARIEGVPGTRVRVDKVSDRTRLINAEAVGYGPSTTVVLWDTVFDGRLSRRAIDVVAAHELGHVARRHLIKGIGWAALFELPLLFLVAEATRRRGGMHRPEVVPFALLVIAVLNIVATPLVNAVSRHIEAEADWMALRTTRDPAGARSLFTTFSSIDLEQPRPPLWDYVMLENHPTLVQRIAMANAYELRARRAARPPAGS
jgi:STE24 endopeptidase